MTAPDSRMNPMTPPDSVGKVRMPDHWSRGEIALGVGPDGPWVPLAEYQSLQAELTRLQALDRQRQEDVSELAADRDSWRDQASDRLEEWDAMRHRAEAAEAALREAEMDAAKLREALADIYASVPKMPIEPATCDAATDALMNVCYVVGALAYSMPELDAAIGGTGDA